MPFCSESVASRRSFIHLTHEVLSHSASHVNRYTHQLMCALRALTPRVSIYTLHRKRMARYARHTCMHTLQARILMLHGPHERTEAYKDTILVACTTHGSSVVRCSEDGIRTRALTALCAGLLTYSAYHASARFLWASTPPCIRSQ
jgi:hypothetical protein